MKAYGGVDFKVHVFLTSALVGERSASLSCRFTPGTHWIGGWVGPRAGLDDVEKRKISHIELSVSTQCKGKGGRYPRIALEIRCASMEK
jgi:hypothetical protein